MAGRRYKARASITRCFCPPESVLPISPTSVSKPMGICRISSKIAARSRTLGHPLQIRMIVKTTYIFTLMSLRTARRPGGRQQSVHDKRRCSSALMFIPLQEITPSVGRTRPMRILSKVVLPQPEGPTDCDAAARGDVQGNVSKDPGFVIAIAEGHVLRAQCLSQELNR